MPAALHSSRLGAASNGVSTAQLALPRPLTVALHLALAVRGHGWFSHNPDNPECSQVGENCHGTRCCAQSGNVCYERDASFASCLSFCDPDEQKDQDGEDWSCQALRVLRQTPIPDFSDDRWVDMTGSYNWDCRGMECDRLMLHPFDEEKFVAAPQYAPLDPAEYHGNAYGEMLWMTGSFSDELSEVLGNDDSCCGFTNNGTGGCGRCIIVRNPSATNGDWMAVVMKKGRCEDEGTCGGTSKHVVLAVPGFGDEDDSSSVCDAENTFISKEHASTCGRWHENARDTIEGCSCRSMPEDTEGQQYMKDGCSNFERWGWTSARDVRLQYQPVECPREFVNAVRGAFGVEGVSNVTPPPDLIPLWPFILGGTTCLVCLLVGTFFGIRRNVLKKQNLLDPADGI